MVAVDWSSCVDTDADKSLKDNTFFEGKAPLSTGPENSRIIIALRYLLVRMMMSLGGVRSRAGAFSSGFPVATHEFSVGIATDGFLKWGTTQGGKP